MPRVECTHKDGATVKMDVNTCLLYTSDAADE